jgi:disulfide bond formation protein DsbB
MGYTGVDMDAPFFAFVNTTIMVGTLILQVLSVALCLGILNVPGFKRLIPPVVTNGMKLSLIALLAAVFGSLYYSEVAGFPACILCWYQRIAIYPQVVLFTLALSAGRRDVFYYTNTLSIIGLGIALYNIAIQTFQTIPAFCDPLSTTVSCLEKYVEGFGYITIPVMAATLFIFLLLIGWAVRKHAPALSAAPLA